MRIRCARKNRAIQPVDKLVGRIGKIALHFLLDRPAFLVPLRLRIVDPAQARGLRLQRHIHVRRWNRRKVLRDALLGVRVVFASQQRIDGRGLVGRHPRAAAKRHVLLRVSHPRKPVRGFVAAHQKVRLDRGHRGQSAADNHYPHSIRQRSAGYRQVVPRGSSLSGRSRLIGRVHPQRRRYRPDHQQQNQNSLALQREISIFPITAQFRSVYAALFLYLMQPERFDGGQLRSVV